MKILIVTDAWKPQVNGVVTTLIKIQELSKEVCFVTPDDFKTFKNPFYPEIRLCFPSQKNVQALIEKHNPDYIHISTEGPLGFAFRKWCLKNKKKFTTSYHTKFPEFLQAFWGIPTWMTFWYFKLFHNSGSGMFVATPSLAKELKSRGFKNLISWTRGVDISQFYPDPNFNSWGGKKILLYVGRVSKEKNIDAFLEANISEPHIKVVVGDGPELEKLKKQYAGKDVLFMGKKTGVELANAYRAADCFVFSSKADTFGLVTIEALACGVPVAAYPVTGPIDILNDRVGAMDDDLSVAIERALKLDRKECAEYAKKYDWIKVVDSFVEKVIETNTEM